MPAESRTFLRPRARERELKWALEVEAKVKGARPEDFSRALRKAGFRKVFVGTLTTTRFSKDGLDGFSARLRTKTGALGRTAHLFTIKRDAESSLQNKVTRAKYEREGHASTLGKARQGLMEELKRLSGKKQVTLTGDITDVKHRVSYRCSKGKYAGVQVDFDRVTRYKGEKPKEPLEWGEIEAETKEQVLRCARLLGIELDPDFAPLSSRSVMKKFLNGEK